MTLTPERKDALFAELDALVGLKPPQPPKPKVVVEAGAVVRDADVVVSPSDVNAQRRGGDTGVSVRRATPTPPEASPLPRLRPGEVRIDMAEAERQWWLAERDREADRAHRRQIDPVGLGHWGRWDD